MRRECFFRRRKKSEIKNVGSFRDVEKALGYEITRQKTMSGPRLRLNQKLVIGMMQEK